MWLFRKKESDKGYSDELNRYVIQIDYLHGLSKWIIRICGLDKLSWVTKNNYSYALSGKKVFRSFKLNYPNVKNRNFAHFKLSRFPDSQPC